MALPFVGILTDKDDYAFEDTLDLSIGIVNPEKERKVNLFLAVTNTRTDEYWFFPSWTNKVEFIPVTLPADFSLPLTNILTIPIPSVNPPMTYDKSENWNNFYSFYFAVFDEDNKELLD